MRATYLLPRELHATAVTSLRQGTHGALKISDPAARVVTDFRRDTALTVTEDLALEFVFDEMFRLGARAFLVVREQVVTGLITAEHARADSTLERLRSRPGAVTDRLRVADVMTASADVPAIDWRTIEVIRIGDLVEIFRGSGAQHLLVLEDEMPNLCRVRGLVHRVRLERQLGARWLSTP